MRVGWAEGSEIVYDLGCIVLALKCYQWERGGSGHIDPKIP